jgi:hypothetical protein
VSMMKSMIIPFERRVVDELKNRLEKAVLLLITMGMISSSHSGFMWFPY